MNAEDLTEAVNECLSRCARSTNVYVYIAEYTLWLRDTKGWEAADADAVGRAALQQIRQRNSVSMNRGRD